MFRFTNDYSNKSLQYTKAGITGTLILAYKEFDKLFNQYLKEGKRALDFGCGAGRSTRYLKETGLSVHGVDIDPSMLIQARMEDRDDIYHLIEDNKIPQRDAYYDLVFSSLVLLEIPTLHQMQ